MMLDFLDTNIIVYANDRTDTRKQEIAIDLIGERMKNGGGVISTQVLQEYAVNALGKLEQAVPVVMHQLRLLEFLKVVTIEPESVRRALEVAELYGISYWDALIVSAAEKAGCARILTEDLNPGQFYCGMECVDPFASDKAPGI
jgi:predicted nucleic acid-binding protein